jgi:hypothetical protein
VASPARITLPPSGRPVGGLLSAARPIGGQWWRGVMFASGQCLSPEAIGPCSGDGGSPVDKPTQRPSEPATFQAFNVYQAAECTTLGRSDIRAFAESSLDVTREFGVALELLAGTATGNPSLGDATDLGAATDPVSALGCLDQMAAQSLSGRLAFIHASPAIAVAWMNNGAMWRDGRIWRTASGNVVVVSPGYDGRAPGGSPAVVGDSLYAYVTGEVYAEVGQRETLQSVERAQNTDQAWAEDAALVAFDPCFVAAIDTTVILCGVGS